MKRGELWTVAGGVYASKPRPALVLQDDRYSGTDSLTVLPLTTTPVDAPLLRIAVPATTVTGISRASYVMVDKVTTVRRSSVSERIGRIPATAMVQVERALVAFLGLAD